MPDNTDTSAVMEPIKDLNGPRVLLELLRNVPEFVDVRQRLSEAHQPFWQRLSDLYRSARTIFTPQVDYIKLQYAIFQELCDYELALAHLAAYERGLKRITESLRSPRHLYEQMVHEDLTFVPDYKGLASDAARQMLSMRIVQIDQKATMALKKLGYVACPNCSRPAGVGIAKDGRGNAINVYFRPCMMMIQTSRRQELGERILSRVAPDGSNVNLDPGIFES